MDVDGARSDAQQGRVPATLGEAGGRIWRSVADEYDLDEHEKALLLEVARTADVLEQLDAVVRADGPIVRDSKGRARTHPAAVEARQTRILLARLVAALRLPSGDDGDRPQRRGGARGVYSGAGASARNTRRRPS